MKNESLILFSINNATKNNYGNLSFGKYDFYLKTFLITTTFIFIFIILLIPLPELDLWFHLRCGELIYQTRSIPHKDIFSYGDTGYWVSHEWLSQVMFYVLYTILNTDWVIIIFKVIIGILTFIILYKQVRLQCDNIILSLTVTILSTGLILPGIVLRPQIFTYLFLTLVFYLITLYHYKNKNLIFLIPFIFLLWANLHGGFIIGIAFIIIYIFGEFIKNIFPNKKLSNNTLPLKKLQILVIVLFTSLVLGLVNPSFYKIYTYSLTPIFKKDIINYIGEWQPLNFSHFYFKSRWLFLYFILLLNMVSFIYALFKNINLTDLILWVVFTYLLFLASRNLYIFPLVTAPFVAKYFGKFLQDIHKKYEHSFSNIFRTILISVWGLSMLVVLLANSSIPKGKKLGQLAIKNINFPMQAISFLENNYKGGNIFNKYAWGSYLIWYLYPKFKVGIDGRADTVYNNLYLKSYFNLEYKNLTTIEKFLNKYKIDFVLLAPISPMVTKLLKSNNWKLIYADKLATIFIKR